MTDNAANMKKAISLNDDWSRIPCFAHTLQLVVDGALNSPKNSYAKDIEKLFKKCKKIVTHFSKSSNARETLMKAQEKNDGHSEYDMLERMKVLEGPLSSVLGLLKMMTITPKEWKLIESCVNVLRPFKEATVIMSGDKYPTASMYLPIVIGLKEDLKETLKNVKIPKLTSEIAFNLLQQCKVSIRYF